MQKTTKLGPINIIGIELKTTNDNGIAFKEIPPFWQKFYQENIIGKISNKLSNDVYAIYTNFENEGINNKGIYSLIIGCPVSDLNNVPENLVSFVIPPSDYAVFDVEKGKPDKVGEKWQEIWKLSEEDKDFDKKRSYIAEFEHYKSSGEINIYIGLKSK